MAGLNYLAALFFEVLLIPGLFALAVYKFARKMLASDLINELMPRNVSMKNQAA
jgi:hypothetical protein